MRKRIAMRNFIALAVVAIIGIVLTVFSFNVPSTYNIYNGFISGLPRSSELTGGFVAHFETSKNDGFEGDYNKSLEKVVNEFNTFFSSQFTNYAVVKTENGLRLEFPNTNNSGNVVSIIDGAGSIEFKAEESDTAEAKLTGKHIESATFASNGGTPGVLIQFTSEGKTLFHELTTERQGNTIYIYVGGNLFFTPTVNDPISAGVTFISGNMNSEFEARAYALKITSSILGVNLNVDGNIVSTQPILGENTHIYLAVIGAVLFVATLAVMALKYKDLGLIGVLSVVFTFITFFLLLNLIPGIELSIASILSILTVFILSVVTHLIMFENIIKEFKTGKKIPLSIRIAQKTTQMQSLDLLAPIAIVSVVLMWFGNGMLKAYALPLLAGTGLVALFTLIVTKGLINMYLPINSTNYNKFGADLVEVEHE